MIVAVLGALFTHPFCNNSGGHVSVRERRVVVHIGPGKTGTTHTQWWLEKNADRLLTHGWAWPRDSVRNSSQVWLSYNGHHDLAPSLCDCHPKQMSGPLGHFTDWFAPDAKAARGIREKWQARFHRAAKEAPNLIVSSEHLGGLRVSELASCANMWARMRKMLQSAGFTSFTVVATLREPLVAWMRSSYNQAYQGSQKAWRLSQPQLFSPTWEKLRATLNQDYAGNLAAARAAGFHAQVVDLGGAAEAGTDQTDVLACEVLGIRCDVDRHWPYPAMSSGASNSRESAPDNTPIVALAWKLHCQNRSLPPMKSLLSLGRAVNSIRTNCTDYRDLEMRGSALLDEILHDVCVRPHRAPTAAPEDTSLIICHAEPAELALLPIFQRACRD